MPSTMPKAVEYLRRVDGGITQPQLMRCDDDRVYAVKFDNPFPHFGLRVLPAELVASRIARSLGVRTPEIRVVNVGQPFLQSNPDVAFRFDDGGTQQPNPGPALGSEWVEEATAVGPHQVPTTPENTRILASLFVADNLLWMNDDHARNYGNLLLDGEQRVWVIDWGHPFFLNGCNDWSEERITPYLDRIAPVAKPLLDIPDVRALVAGASQRASALPQEVVADVFREIPEEWRSPRPGGVTEHECQSAQAFLLQRARLLPELVQTCLTWDAGGCSGRSREAHPRRESAARSQPPHHRSMPIW